LKRKVFSRFKYEVYHYSFKMKNNFLFIYQLFMTDIFIIALDLQRYSRIRKRKKRKVALFVRFFKFWNFHLKGLKKFKQMVLMEKRNSFFMCSEEFSKSNGGVKWLLWALNNKKYQIRIKKACKRTQNVIK